MKVKLDENLGKSSAALLAQLGCDVATVAGQGLTSAKDKDLIQVCHSEGRCLVTLDLDFSNPLVFRPSDFSGIAVLRLTAKPSPEDLTDVLKTLAIALTQSDVEGKLWIVQKGKIREYQG